MPHVLAIEPDRAQASMLSDLLYDVVGRRPAVVDNVDAAIAAIDRRVPALILLNALMPPVDELRLLDHLRTFPRSVFVQTLITPVFPDERPRIAGSTRGTVLDLRQTTRSWTGAFAEFAEQLRVYLEIGGAPRDFYRGRADRRVATRTSNVDRARVAIRGLDVNVVDLSMTGAQIVSPSLHIPGTVVPVTIGDDLHRVECEAVIVWGTFEIRPSTQTPHYRAGVAWKGVDDALLESLCGPQSMVRWAPSELLASERGHRINLDGTSGRHV